jgi:formate dehydrogenase subunit gamma
MEKAMSTALPEALRTYGLWGMGGTILLLGLFALARGRVRIEAGWGGWTIARFGGFERLVHWVLALSFIVLGLTGLGMSYGARLLAPLAGDDGLAVARQWSATLHHYAAVPFMAALALAALLWVRHSLPHWRDAVWLGRGGGLLVRRWHPAAWKLNAGQKAFFWSVMLVGLALSLTGLALLFPFRTALFSKAFAILNGFGLALPANLTPAEETRLALAWHTASAVVLTCVVVVHVYLRTWGIQGAAAAMSSGEVDVNWARQHHSLWAERETKRMEEETADAAAATAAPAE